MNFKYLPLLLMIFLLQCSYANRLFKKESFYYTDSERDVVEKTTKVINFDFGYDPEIELDYIYSTTKEIPDLKSKDADFRKSVAQTDPKLLVSSYGKVFMLRQTTAYRMQYYKQDNDWRYYIYLQKYLLPAVDAYTVMLEKHISERDKSFKDNLPSIKKKLDDEAVNMVKDYIKIKSERKRQKILNISSGRDLT